MKYLTKSRFKLALTCPTKLYYNELPEEYTNTQVEDSFLKALADRINKKQNKDKKSWNKKIKQLNWWMKS
jgi:hypothetical protein